MTKAKLTNTEFTRVWHHPDYMQLELLHARFLRQTFPKHSHEVFALGVIEGGALNYLYRGASVTAASGDINLCVPGEVHTGQPASPEGWSYRMFYFDARLLQQVASRLALKAQPMPFFQSSTINDPATAVRIRKLHQQFESGAGRLEHESHLMDVLAQFIRRHADARTPVFKTGQEPKAVIQIKRYLAEHLTEDVSLDALVSLTGLSRYYLVRAFHEAVGMPPHQYLRQLRVNRAKTLLATNLPLAEIALATGFSDQSHLNRWFRRFWGYTPGHYRNSVQDRPLVKD
ncbi:MAG: AraC family transcriptional regulator [Trueperaceae bacterium]|nr:AraC family transcriptional regulator [Trueperaceae bacterium]